jgi:4-amino-4-deoxy-L-arabinose transferase-like glycosyltransferase
MNGKNVGNWIVLVVHLLVILLYHNLVYTGHYGYDDMEYAKAAVDLLEGEPDFTNHFAHRLSITVLTAAAFALVGVTDTGAALPALLFGFLIAILLASLLWKKGPIALAIGLSVAMLPQWFLFYTDKLMPDMAVAFFVFAAVAAYWFAITKSKKYTRGFAFAFSLSLLLGFLAKGTIVLALPWVLVMFTIDLFQKKEKTFWMTTVGSGVLLLGIYFFATWWMTGSFSSRFSAITGNAYLNACSYSELPTSFLFERVTNGFWEMGIRDGLLPGMVFLLAGLIGKKFKLINVKPSLLTYSLLTGLVFLLSANFMTISPASYNPMCLDVRHYLFLMPILALPAALVFIRFISEGRNRIILPLIGFVFAFIAYQIDLKGFEKLWLPLAIVLLIGAIPVAAKRASFIFPVLVFGIMLIIPWEMFSYSDQVKYPEQKTWTIEQLEKLERGSTVYTNPVQERLTRYYLGFDTADIKVQRYSDLEKTTETSNQSFLLFNPYTLQLSGLSNDDLPYSVRYPTEVGKLIVHDAETEMELYRMTEIVSPRNQGAIVVFIDEDFEDTNSELEFAKANFIERAGRSAYALREYSGTLRIPFDSISASGEKQVFALVDLDAYAEVKTTARIVVSIEKNGEVLFRDDKQLVLKGFIFGAWNTVKTELRLPIIEDVDSKLLIYIWNPEGDNVYIDNLHLSINSLQRGIKKATPG